ncbi:MAG: right-handed parallel beta-helix repeat-containing protein [bacterium]|nr:right-handed parallel beta-helix repeat-containing protein [bacterium]
MKRALVSILLGAAPLCAAVHYVAPAGGHVAPFTNWLDAATDIQAAIDSAQAGDTVLVTDGVYTITAPITIASVPVNLTSINGAAATIVDAANACQACFASMGSVIDGFTFTRGYVDGDDAGGGVALGDGILRNCIISASYATYGGGVIAGGDALVEQCQVISNTAARAGGGMVIANGGVAQGCSIIGNAVSDVGAQADLYLGGGGVLLFQGGTLLRATVSNNVAGSFGGGVTIFGTGVVDRSVIAGNRASTFGGGVACLLGGFLQSCLVMQNGAYEGGGIYVLTNARVHNCTIAGNVATIGGGVVNAYGGTNLNNIMYFNTAATNPNYAVYGTARLIYNCTTPAVSNQYDGRGCITANPAFMNYAAGNLQLSNSSPCIDTGTNLAGMRLLLDLAGNGRVSNIVEMGAYERGYPAPHIAITSHVDAVTYDVATVALAGTNSPALAGRVWLRNAANNAAVSVAPTGTSWQAPALALAVGTNVIAAFGTNTDGFVAIDACVILRGAVGTGVPFVDITNKNMKVIFDMTTFYVSGTNNINVIGEQWLTNTANGYYQRFYATSNHWFSIAAPLAMNTNIIWVFGTNLLGAVTNDTVTIVREGATGTPFIGITTTVASVTYDVTTLALAGTNNEQLVGFMWLTNASGANVSFAAQNPWAAPAVPLLVGTNTLVVFGTNLVDQTASAALVVTRGEAGTGQPFVDCTNANITVPNDISSFACAGTNNANAIGVMRVRNLVTGQDHYFPAAPAWVAPALDLVVGLNDIQITGINSSGTPYYDLVLVTRQGVATGPPFVDVLSSNAAGTYDMTTAVVTGTNNANVVAAMWISNAVTHSTTYFTSQLQWTSPSIALAVGPNELWAVGQNAAGTQALDSVTVTRGAPGTGLPEPNAVFTAAPGWTAPAVPLGVGMNGIFVFATNSAGTFGYDAAIVVREPPGSGVPLVTITTPPGTVLPEITAIQISGSNNANVIGMLVISNAQSGSSATLPATMSWTSAPIPLAMGWNDIIVWGTNAYNAATSATVRITRGDPGTGAPVISLFNTNTTVTFDVAAVTLRGAINFNVVGSMWASNAANAALASFIATQYWAAPLLDLVVGTNVFTVYGTNYLNAVTNATVTIMRGAPGTGLPRVCITSAVFIVAHDVSTYVIAGTNNPNVVGSMWVSNNTQVTVLDFPAAPAWATPPVPLDRHINILSVFGSNALGQIGVDRLMIDRPVPSGVTNFVAASGAHLWPYITWETAATNILDAVNEAVSGNMVLVAPGTNVITSQLLVDCDIQVQSVSGAAASVILAASPQARAVHMLCGVLDGFTIMPVNGGASQIASGAGLWLDGGGLVRNCAIAGFSATSEGGGIYCDSGTISNCLVIGNQAGWIGGGVCLDNAARLFGSIIAGNRATKGGGAYVFDGTISDCFFYANAAMPTGTTQIAVQDRAQQRDSSDYGGGGVLLDNGGQLLNSVLSWNQAWDGAAVHVLSEGLVQQCQIAHNTSVYYSAVYCQYGGTIDRCTMTDNAALSGAGLMLNYGGSARNCVIARNRANTAAGVYAVGSVTLENCTIAANIANGSGGGLSAGWGPLVRNSIIYHNTAPVSPDVALLNGDVTIEYSCSTPLQPGPGNTASNPALANVAAGFFCPTAGSPCINAGINQPWMSSAVDFAGRPRIIHGIVDIGAYEFTNGPIIWATPVEIDFGTLTLGDRAIVTVTVANAGTELLSGVVQNVAAPFAVEAGATYQLAPNAQEVVVLSFTPDDEQHYLQTAQLTGGGDATIVLYGIGIRASAPYLDITNTTPPVLSYEITAFTLGITNNAFVVGTRRWANELTSENGALAGNVATIPLGVGANLITVTGTNEWNVSASDTITITRGGSGTGTPYVDITNATPPTLSYDATSFTLGITNNAHVVGTRRWANALTSASGALAGNVATIPLGVGANLITVTGTNAWNVSASDTITITRGDIGTGTPYVDITNATPPTLGYDVTSFTLGITNNMHVVGTRRWANPLTSESGVLAGNVATIPLGVGANVITVTGTNEWAVSASDSMTVTRGGSGTGTPFVDITNSLAGPVNNAVNTFTVSGTNNIHVVGTMWWVNAVDGSTGVFDASSHWQAAVPLQVGMNPITVWGTNLWALLTNDMVAVIRLPSAPTAVNATDGSFSDKVRVTYAASVGASKYMVYRASASAPTNFVALSGELLTNTFDDTTAAPGVKYYYTVQAGSVFGWSALAAPDAGYAMFVVNFSGGWSYKAGAKLNKKGKMIGKDILKGTVVNPPLISYFAQGWQIGMAGLFNGTLSNWSGPYTLTPNKNQKLWQVKDPAKGTPHVSFIKYSVNYKKGDKLDYQLYTNMPFNKVVYILPTNIQYGTKTLLNEQDNSQPTVQFILKPTGKKNKKGWQELDATVIEPAE